MKVDYLSIHFKTSMISSRTKHESFDSFGSHAQLLMGTSHSFFFYVMNLSSLFIFQKKDRNLLQIQDQNIRRTLLTKQIIVSKVVFFSSNPKNSYYFIHRSPISHCIKKGMKYPFFPFFTVKGSNHFIDMSVLYRKRNSNYFFGTISFPY